MISEFCLRGKSKLGALRHDSLISGTPLPHALRQFSIVTPDLINMLLTRSICLRVQRLSVNSFAFHYWVTKVLDFIGLRHRML
jgi:hypothetical protein